MGEKMGGDPVPQGNGSEASKGPQTSSTNVPDSQFSFGVQMPPPPGPAVKRVVKKLDPLIEKTKLDLDACRQVVSRMVSDKEVQIKAQVEAKSKEPAQLLPCVEKYRMAIACGSDWDQEKGTGRFRVCSQCQLHLYDFSDLSQEQANELIFQREGKQNPSLYKRRDGKFLTSDCPVGVKRGRTMLALIAGSVLALGAAIAFMLLAPPPPPPPAVVETKPADGPPVEKKETVTEIKDETKVPNLDATAVGAPSTTGPASSTPAPEMQSLSGRYVTVPIEVFEGSASPTAAPGGTPATSPPAAASVPTENAPPQPAPASTPPASSPAPQAGNNQAPAAVPATPATPESAPAPSQPAGAAPAGNPYVKNY